MCNNNCCMCCNCNTNTNNEETPQEVVYTAVCNSVSCLQNNQCGRCCKCCNCEKYKAHCEDDPENMVLALQEHMEDCCTQVGERLDTLECELDREICRSKSKDTEHDTKIEDLYAKESLDYNNVNYTLDNHNLVVNFYHDDVFQDKITIPVESFIKDWFVDSVALIDDHILRISFNVDPVTQTQHPSPIDIDLNDFLNPSNYYTKTQIDAMINPLSQTITNLTNNLNNYKIEVSNTYETKVAAGNHIKEVDYDANDHHTLIFTRENGNTITRTIPDNDKWVQSGEYTGGNLVLTKNNGDTVTIPVPATNHVVGGSISGHTITLTRENNGTPITIQLPADANTYPVSGSVTNHKLTLVMNDGSTTSPITLPDDNDNKYVTGGSVSNNQLTLTYNDNTTAPAIDLSSIVLTDHNNYVDTATLGNNNILSLGRTGGLSPVTVDLSSLANGVDQDHYPTAATLSGNTLTFTGNSGFTPFSVDLSNIAGAATDYDHYSTSGTYSDSAKKITISGNSGFSSFDIDLSALVARIEALEGLWEVNPNNSNQVIAKSGRSAMAAGFYDSTVS